MNLEAKRDYEGRPYGAVGTIVLSLAAFTLTFLGQLLGSMLFILVKYGAKGFEILTDENRSAAMMMEGDPLAMATIGSALLTAPALILFTYLRKGISVNNYLGFRLPTLRQTLLFLLGTAVLIGFSDLSSHLMNKPIVHPFVEKALRTSEMLPLLFIGIAIAAPLVEELLFRGFLFEGFPRSQLGQIAAIAMTSLLWAVIHVQYELFYLVHIFILGLYLGFVKVKTGSTSLPILLHCLINAFAMGQAYLHITSHG